MARSRGYDYQDQGEAKPDIFLAMIIISFFNTLLATIIMWWEYSAMQ
jgi:hypothetical protein